ncbi:hypothetical protein ACP4OV_027390 [Aristida adscensionis]
MAASPGTAPSAETESVDMHPSPPPASSPAAHPLHESPSQTTAAPLEAAHLDQATSTPTPPPGQGTEDHSLADYLPPPPPPPPLPPTDGEPSLPPPGAAPAESTALDAASAEKPASHSPRSLDEAAEVSVVASAPLPPPSPQIGEALPEDALQPSPPATPTATASRASPDSSTTEAVAMPLQEAAPPPPGPESVDAGSHPAPAPLTQPLEGGPEGLLLQQQPRPPFPEMATPPCENSEPPRPSSSPSPAESTCTLADAAADEAVAAASKEAAGSPPALEATNGETNTTPGVPVASENGAELSLSEPVQTPSSPGMEDEPCSPEMAPPGFENFKSQWLPVPPPTRPAGFTDSLGEGAATNAVGVTPVAAAGSIPALEAMDMEMDKSLGQQPQLKNGAEGQLQQPLLVSYPPMMEAAPCSPDMPPPGFGNFKSWLPQPTLAPLGETTHSLPDVTASNLVAVMFAEKASLVSTLEATDVEKDTGHSLLPPLESGSEGSSQGTLPRAPSPVIKDAPSSPDMAPPGFENSKFLQPEIPSSPVPRTACRLQESATIGALYVTTAEFPNPSPAVDAVDTLMDTAPAPSPPSGSEEQGSSPQVPPRLPSCMVHGTACSIEMIPSGSDNVESLQNLPQTAVLPLVQTPDILEDAVTKKTVPAEVVHHQLPVSAPVEEAKEPIQPPPLENGSEGPLPHLKPQASSRTAQAACTSPEIAPVGSENLESSTPATKLLTLKSENSVQATGTDLKSSAAVESPSKHQEGSLTQPQHEPSSPSCSPQKAPPGYEHSESSEQLPPPPPLCTKFEIGQMVCGCCRSLIAYPKGAVHVQCGCCGTINLVLEEHQVGKVYCGQCETLLMYPFGAPAVRCSNCRFVTEIGERNVRRRISMDQSASPQQEELTEQS